MNLDVTLDAFLNCRRWWIAYSGGVDSHVLLHLLAQLRKEKKTPPLIAIHINHQLNSRAHEWAEHCRRTCAELDIEFICEAVNVVNKGNGVEAAARSARYAAFEKHIDANELLLQAHHRDDQIETLMLRLLRGNAIASFTSIPPQRALGRGQLLRPLLSWSRSDVLAYAHENGLTWIEDDSNGSDRFDRNFLRLNVLPIIQQRWPSYRETLSRMVDQAKDTAALLDELAAVDARNAINENGELSVSICASLSEARQCNVVRFWLRQKKLPQPSREQLRQLLAMMHARIDAQPCVQWPGVEVHRFRNRLYAFAPLPAPPIEPIDIEWQLSEPLTIEGLGTLTAAPMVGAGLRADLRYRVRNRIGGERCKPVGRVHSQTLKKLLQEYDVPPWLRDRLPIIYCGDQIAVVGGLWVCEGFNAGANQNGWCLQWRQN